MSSMTVNELKNFINSNTLIDTDYSESSIGSMVSSYLNITEPVDLWKVFEHVKYRNPIINDFKTQEFQTAGLTWYFREGTCVDISRLSYFVAKSIGWKTVQLIVFNSSWSIGHAVTIVQANNLSYVIDFNNILILPSDYQSYIDEIGAFIENEQTFTPSVGFYTAYESNQISSISQVSIKPSTVTHLVETYPSDDTAYSITNGILIVGIVFLIILLFHH